MGRARLLAVAGPAAAAALWAIDAQSDERRICAAARLTVPPLDRTLLAGCPGGEAQLASSWLRSGDGAESPRHDFRSAKADASAASLGAWSLGAAPPGANAAAQYARRSFDGAASLAAQHAPEMAALRQRLSEAGVRLPAPRFGENNAELMRFAITMGLATAATDAERQHAVEATAERVAEAVAWLSSHTFLPAERLPHWEHLLRWRGADAEGHPVLRIALGRATRECRGAELDEFAEAIIAQVQHALDSKLSDAPGKPEQLVVVCDCAGMSSRQGSHVLRLIKSVSLALNRFYPGRLHCFYLVDVPAMIRWPVKAIIALGHPSTRSKVLLCRSGDARLAVLP